MRALNYAKVIKLPSHSILATHTQSEDIKQEWRNGVPTSRNREEACRTVVPLAPFPLLSLLLLYPRSAFVLQHIWEDERINSEDAGSLWMSIVESSFVFLVAGIKQWQGQSLFVCMLPFFFLALCVLLCFFFFGFFLSWFFFSFLGWFFFSPFLPMYYFFLWVFALVLLLFFFLLSGFWSFILGLLLPFIEIPQPLRLTSPAFAGLLFSTNEIIGERRGPRLDRIRCRFSSGWRRRTWLFHQHWRRFGSNGHFHFDP
jgi:hypothetical protein